MVERKVKFSKFSASLNVCSLFSTPVLPVMMKEVRLRSNINGYSEVVAFDHSINYGIVKLKTYIALVYDTVPVEAPPRIHNLEFVHVDQR